MGPLGAFVTSDEASFINGPNYGISGGSIESGSIGGGSVASI